VYPAVAIAREIADRSSSSRLTFVGRPASFESELLAREGFEMDAVDVGRLAGQGAGALVRTLIRLPAAVLRARAILRRRRPQVVIGTGGFVSGPTMLAAASLRIPTLVQEQNAIPGLTNRVLRRLARRVALAHESPSCRTPKHVVTGNPVRPEFFGIAPWTPHDPACLLVLGGSQGARALTSRVMEALGLLGDVAPSLRAVIQTGPRWEAEARELAKDLAVEVEIEAYVHDVPRRLEEASFVLCRAGASTVAEVCAAGRPALLVPFPFAAGDHQTANAVALARQGAAEWVAEADLSAERLAARLRRAMAEPAELSRLATAARSLARQDAAARIVDLAEAIALVDEAAA